VGPNLDALAPDQPAIVNEVAAGGAFMPSFAAALSPAQINDVASYVYQSTHG
jgi:mono/diheme cytochrome c family protein